jgi:colanic acid/amylovoran biosynthesis glycosyltransferase
VARLTEIKGHEYAIRAVAKLKVAGAPIRYDVVGDGPLRKKLEELVRELGLETTVVFHGACAGDEIKVLYAQAHLFLLTSVSVEGDQEGQGLVLQEAQACGLPVIGTQHGALPDGLLDGQSGWLVPQRDVEALAERILSAIAHASDWPALGRAGRKFVETRYDVRNLNRQLVAIYAEAIAGHRKSE